MINADETNRTATGTWLRTSDTAIDRRTFERKEGHQKNDLLADVFPGHRV